MGKRLLALICLIGISLFLGVSFVSAQTEAIDCTEYCSDPYDSNTGMGTYTPPSGSLCLCPPTSATTLEGLLDNIVDYIFWFATAITPILVIVGGFYFMTSGGSVEKVTTAKRIIVYTVIGYMIILFARGLVYILADLLGAA